MPGKSKLVYTTDKSEGMAVNCCFPDIAVSDAGRVARETVAEINRIKRRYVVMGEKRVAKSVDSVNTEKRLSTMVGFIYSEPKTYKEVYKHLFGDDRTRARRWTYLTQLVKYGSDGIVFYNKKTGLWTVDPSRRIPFVDLMKKIIDNKGKMYGAKGGERQKAPLQDSSQTGSDVVSKTVSFSISKSGKPVELSIKIQGDEVLVTIKVG